MFPFHKFDTNDNKRTHLLSENGLHDHEPPAVAILNSNPFRDFPGSPVVMSELPSQGAWVSLWSGN